MPSETSFRSDETFTQRTFRRWVDARPMSDCNHYELIGGHIVMTPPAGWMHGGLDNLIGSALGNHVRRHRLGYVFGSSAGYDLPSGDTLEPDASFLSTARFDACPPRRPSELLKAVPNLVVEILSPAASKRDRTEKKALYAVNGVDEYWLVDPLHRAVTVFGLGPDGYDAGRTVIAGSIRSRVLPKLRLPVAKLFQR
jgi:Uma2 family endonuclease